MRPCVRKLQIDIRCLKHVKQIRKLEVLEAAKRALTEYLHFTRAIPFVVAENVSNNSNASIFSLISRVHFPSLDLSSPIQKFLRYHPVNEFEFFYESIGLDDDTIKLILPAKGMFMSDNQLIIDAVCELYAFGFPWNRLGLLFKERSCIFDKVKKDLVSKLNRFKEYGFDNDSIVGICLAFPSALSGDMSDEEVAGLFHDMQMLPLDCGAKGTIESSIESCYQLCKKVKVFYDMGCKKGNVGEFMSYSKISFLDFPIEILIQKTEYFCKFGVCKEDVGLLIIKKPEILDIDIETRMFSVGELLKHLGMSDNELKSYSKKYPYVFGINTIANLPNVMKGMELSEWLFGKMNDGNQHLLANYKLSDYDCHLEVEYKNGLQKVYYSSYPTFKMKKLAFMHELGFGQNALTVRLLRYVKGDHNELRDRASYLLDAGLDFSKLLFIISSTPRILSINPKDAELKINYLCSEIGFSVHYLYDFPEFICFSLENRIIPRHRFFKWLGDKGVPSKDYTIASIVGTSTNRFTRRLYHIYPPALKHYLEGFHVR